MNERTSYGRLVIFTTTQSSQCHAVDYLGHKVDPAVRFDIHVYKQTMTDRHSAVSTAKGNQMHAGHSYHLSVGKYDDLPLQLQIQR